MSASHLHAAASAGPSGNHRQEATCHDAWRTDGFSPAHLTLGDVARAQRWAWRPARSGEFPTYSFDGINFWWQPRRHERIMVSSAVVPSDGWRHRASCNCGRCGGSCRM